MHRFLIVIETAGGNYSAYSPDLPAVSPRAQRVRKPSAGCTGDPDARRGPHRGQTAGPCIHVICRVHGAAWPGTSEPIRPGARRRGSKTSGMTGAGQKR